MKKCELEIEVMRWKRIAAYLALCNADTLKIHYRQGTMSHRARKRILVVCRKSEAMMDGRLLPNYTSIKTVDGEVTNAIEECRKAIKERINGKVTLHHRNPDLHFRN